ncbi:unnamed protein product [Schistocephalus solidus]|uniref:RT_RNaseH_2 domain-containing protein n=1 Tax=Schistocephalus solidus TaxID=70667 RepID=A0A183TPG8_SCHSO|nr:unnamed protein product [Schistocephalus solidus]
MVPTSAEQLISILQQQQVHFEAVHMKMAESMMQQFSLHFPDPETSTRDAEIRTHLLSKIEQDPDSTLQTLAAECQWFKNLKHDSAIMDQPSSSLAATSVHAITHTKSIHYGSFLPDMYRLHHPRNELLKKDVKWIWSRERQQAFEEVKLMLSSDLLLTHFNPDLMIVVAAEASDYGIVTEISHVFPTT